MLSCGFYTLKTSFQFSAPKSAVLRPRFFIAFCPYRPAAPAAAKFIASHRNAPEHFAYLYIRTKTTRHEKTYFTNLRPVVPCRCTGAGIVRQRRQDKLQLEVHAGRHGSSRFRHVRRQRLAKRRPAPRLERERPPRPRQRQLRGLPARRNGLVSQDTRYTLRRQRQKDIHLLRGRLQPQRGVPKRPPFRQTSQRLHLVHVRRHSLRALRRRERGCRARGPQPQRRLPLVHRLGNIPQRVARESRPAAHSAMGRVCLAKRSKHAAGNAQCRD